MVCFFTTKFCFTAQTPRYSFFSFFQSVDWYHLIMLLFLAEIPCICSSSLLVIFLQKPYGYNWTSQKHSAMVLWVSYYLLLNAPIYNCSYESLACLTVLCCKYKIVGGMWARCYLSSGSMFHKYMKTEITYLLLKKLKQFWIKGKNFLDINLRKKRKIKKERRGRGKIGIWQFENDPFLDAE